MNTLSILIPAYNEELTIRHVLEAVRDVEIMKGIGKDIIVVNDCSTDGTAGVIEAFIQEHPGLKIRKFDHAMNEGKGAAIHTAIAHAEGDYCIVQDADLEYDPEEYNHLIKPILKVGADVVYGSRFMGNQPHRILFFWHTMGNKFLTFLSNAFTNFNLTDMETCYKMFRTDILKGMKLREKRFGFEVEVTAKISRIPYLKLYEVGVSYYGRTYAEGKKINWKDGVQAIYCIFKYGMLKLN